MPNFLHAIGELKGFVLALDSPEMPAFEMIELSKEGGITMSRNALRSVVNGYPLSSISSSNCRRKSEKKKKRSCVHRMSAQDSDLVDNVELLPQRR